MFVPVSLVPVPVLVVVECARVPLYSAQEIVRSLCEFVVNGFRVVEPAVVVVNLVVYSGSGGTDP